MSEASEELTDNAREVLGLFKKNRIYIDIPTAAANAGLGVDEAVAALEELEHEGHIKSSTIYELTREGSDV